MANNEPVKLKFLYVLTNDYSFILDREIHDVTYNLIVRLKEMGHATGELDKEVESDDLYLILFINTIQFINQRFKKQTNKTKLTQSDEKHLLYLINKFQK